MNKLMDRFEEARAFSTFGAITAGGEPEASWEE
jgi:hypothetical protein